MRFFYSARPNPKAWNSARAMLYGAAVGVAAAALKLFAPWSGPHSPAAIVAECVGAALAFALLCGLAAALRNVLMRRLTPDAGYE
jgi:hypothetical protein